MWSPPGGKTVSAIGSSLLALKAGILGTREDDIDTWEKLPSLVAGDARGGDLALALAAGDITGVL